MKILSYNLYGVKDTSFPILNWEARQKNIQRILAELLSDPDIQVCCFQEVNENNFFLLEKTLSEYNFFIPAKYPMITDSILQYNIVAIKKGVCMNGIFCLPHGKDNIYVMPDKQFIDYNMSDYRTTVFVEVIFNEKKILIGNIHTDYISIEGKIQGCIRSLDYMDSKNDDFKLLVGDINMVCHMSEAYQILQKKSNYCILSRSEKFNVYDQSWHGYGSKESVNVDFSFLPKKDIKYYRYHIIKQSSLELEGSDHRPIIIELELS